MDHPSPRRSRALRAVAGVAVALVALVAGCSTGGSPAAAPSAPAARSRSTAGPRPSLPPDAPTGATVDCGADLAALDAVITEQLDAFAADEWEHAWSLTSRRFRSAGVDADGLRQIVTSGYPEAADAADHEVRGCLFDGDDAQVLIEITSTDGATLDLVYLLTREGGRWRISGAVGHGTGSEPATIPA